MENRDNENNKRKALHSFAIADKKAKLDFSNSSCSSSEDGEIVTSDDEHQVSHISGSKSLTLVDLQSTKLNEDIVKINDGTGDTRTDDRLGTSTSKSAAVTDNDDNLALLDRADALFEADCVDPDSSSANNQIDALVVSTTEALNAIPAVAPASVSNSTVTASDNVDNTDESGPASINITSHMDDTGYDDSDVSDYEGFADELLEQNLMTGEAAKGKNETAEELQKTVLVEYGAEPFEMLPEGWLRITHDSGIPVYLHKASRVITLARPYFIGRGSSRRHEIPVCSIPCLFYKQAREAARKLEEEKQRSESQMSSLPAQPVADEFENALGQQPPASPQVANRDAVMGGETVEAASIDAPKEVARDAVLTLQQIQDYCTKRFEFQQITVKRFKSWKERRQAARPDRQQRPVLSANKLITCPSKIDRTGKKKDFVMSLSNKSAVCILHEYLQQAWRIQPKYKFNELGVSAATPYSATVTIGESDYGTGYSNKKKIAKELAAKETLRLLEPKLLQGENTSVQDENADADYFDQVRIEDPRVMDLCKRVGQPAPYSILLACLHQNYGITDTDVQQEMNALKNQGQKSEYIMRVGKHDAKIICRNKKEGKQRAAQTILQKMHPHLGQWGALHRLYGGTNKILKAKKEQEQSITELQAQAKIHRPNESILKKLREQMHDVSSKREILAVQETCLKMLDNAVEKQKPVTVLDL